MWINHATWPSRSRWSDGLPSVRVVLQRVREASVTVVGRVVGQIGVGHLVLVGFKTRPALLSLGGILVLVTFGHLLKEPLYPFHTHVFPRLALLTVVLLLPREEDAVSLDGFLRARGARP